MVNPELEINVFKSTRLPLRTIKPTCFPALKRLVRTRKDRDSGNLAGGVERKALLPLWPVSAPRSVSEYAPLECARAFASVGDGADGVEVLGVICELLEPLHAAKIRAEANDSAKKRAWPKL
jgi:hypothetical protein